MKELIEYVKDGITIIKNNDGTYRIFTIPTQHFSVDSLEELTPERFEGEIIKEINFQNQEESLWNEFIGDVGGEG